MKKSLLIPLTILLLCCAVAGVAYAQSPEPAGGATSAETTVSNEVLAVSKLITYQGRLLNPTTRVPKADDTYPTIFKLYNHATSTSAANVVWTETQNVATLDGYFTVLLGSVSTFGPTVFNGQNLWLGVAVGGDAEATPRTRMTAVAYALYAETAASATTAQTASNADLLDGVDSAAFTTDAEVVPLVKANDGSGSGLDADTLDGFEGSAYLRREVFADASPTVWNCGDIHFFQSSPVLPSTTVIYRIDAVTSGGIFRLNVTSRETVSGIVYSGDIVNGNTCPGGPWSYKITRFDIKN